MSFFRGPQSPREEPYSSNPLSPPQRNANPNRWSASMAGMSDVRGALQRRFTTNTVPTLSPIGQQRRQAAGDVQMPSAHSRIAPSERAARHYENLLEAQRKIQEELDKVDVDTRREVDENIRHEQSVTQLFAQSEPTTPPEYQTFAANFSRPNRYSAASLTSPPGIATRSNRASAHLASPPNGSARAYNQSNNSNLPSQSVPGSRRQSDGEDDDDDDFVYGYDDISRRAANPNRNSMPITSYDHKRNTIDLSLGRANATSFFFDETDKSNKTSPPDIKTYLQVQHTADGFPKLIRREDNSDLSLSAASAALDLASSTSDAQMQQGTERAMATRHRISLPPSALAGNVGMAPLNGILANANENRSAASNRRSMEVKFTAETKRPALASPPRGYANGPMSSYSTNDIPTLKSINGDTSDGGVALLSPAAQVANIVAGHASPEQNAGNLAQLSISSPRQNQYNNFQLSTPARNGGEGQENFGLSQSALQANAAPFGPVYDNQAPVFGTPNMMQYSQQPAYYGGYGMPAMTNGFNNLNMHMAGGANGFSPQAQWSPSGPAQYTQPPAYGGYQQFSPSGPSGQAVAGAGRFDSPRANTQQRRQAAEEAQAKFNSIKVEQLTGEIYTLCKDQHGCRFLQRKLEERNEQTVQAIFEEVRNHMIELMVDPFGNYLCQKLLESANDDQRTELIKNAMPQMTKIALNQHGTRALQKMIEFISTPEQTALIIEALRNDVVLLIQDLNGNHVIQKCLNHLSSNDAIFIFDAVGANCITVGTHRHGCCVLQRCIDHADGLQKGEMVDHVIRNAYSLVQDPFGNYVVQYILDLSEPCFTEPLCRAFYGEIANLSRQKFSSNVMEKCIRCASNETKRAIISEIMAPQTIEKMLRDGFANYVVQTAMDFADEDLKPTLVENIRMVIPAIRNTPHGRRIQSKISDYDNRKGSNGAPIDSSKAAPPPATFSPQQGQNGRANRQGMIGAPMNWNVNGGFEGADFNPNGMNGHQIASPPPPQRNAHNFSMLNGGQNFQAHNQVNGHRDYPSNGGGHNYQGNGYANQGFANHARQQQPYGHF
ncbi:unnamed protein product [Zymoseptoria tritici ST99CH_1A5]|nr:pumilio-related RNA binding protein [Zymoseptoria tritici IPO323]EGP90362.1 pumilio-related RNA binding protein [Zymoseptoria tritici IPO323]SMR46518.1 unnamed protein product [Zymoseptoria tritici ST99CH_1E4]SMR47761.1 unnamed protein product [Zymoseptoria tritici ST99CH_3D1]SMY21664.1 unnamed protein product [Zymoseptoria tritici ST99CH_1A5]